MEIKNKFCAVCGDEFRPYRTTDRVCCWDCKKEFDQLKEQRKALKAKVNKAEQPLTIQALVNLAQIVFNKYIRLRDAGKPCVSCLGPYQKDFHAGHLHPAGNCWKTRFHEKNVFGQCPECNTEKNANLDEYRINVLLRISPDDLAELDKMANENADFTREFLQDLISKYKAKVDKLEKKKK